MSNYPFSFDSNITLPGVSGSSQEDVAITALRSAVFAIEIELGITPSGIYPDVRTRLDILESRLQFGISPQIPNDGYVKSPLYIWNVPQGITLSISDGYGAPTENRLDGSLYMRGGDGYANNQLYVRLNNQWLPVQTEQFTANNDLAGFPSGSDGHLAQTVIGLYNHPFNVSMDSVGPVQDGYHVTWNNFSGEWEEQTGFIPGRDLMAYSGPYGRTGQQVIGLQGFPLSGFPPTDGYTLVWQASDNRWEPQARAVVFDGYVSRVNLRSNRAQQSPILNTKTGIVNFGTDTSGLTLGATNDYSIILGGNRNLSSGIHSIVIGGFANNSSDGYSLVVGGNANVSSAVNSTVINGVTNTASGAGSTVGNGTSNTASGSNSQVANGTSNTAAANFSTILNGTSNSISVGSLHTLIGTGTTNQISGGASSNFSVIIGGTTNTVSSAENVFIGTPDSSTANGPHAILISGVNNSILTLSDYAAILTGINNTVNASSEYGFIGTGQNNSVTGHFSTILNADTSTADGQHATVFKGLNNSATGPYTTVVNGNNNTVNSAGWGVIIDGYNNSVTGTGSFIADGYNNSISGFFSSILNGNFNIIAGRNSTITNGTGNNIDVNSAESAVIVGNNNTFINSNNALVTGTANILTNASQQFVLGANNNIQSAFSFINGSSNTLASGSAFNRIFGSNNTLGTNSSTNLIVGSGNIIGPANTTSNATVLGTNNLVNATSASFVSGSSNIVSSTFAEAHGQFGKARMFGQSVKANSRFTATTIAAGSNGASLPQATINVASTTGFPASGSIAVITSLGLQSVNYSGTTGTSFTGCAGGTGTMSTGNAVGKIGEAQWSSLVLTGSAAGGAAVQLQLQDSVATNPTFVDGYSYDLSIKVLIVNTSPITPNPVVPARYYIDVLAHQESGILVIDNINYTLSTPNTVDSVSRTPWTVTVSTDGANQMLVIVDVEAASSYVQPSNNPSDRRAIATIEMREISRL